MPAKTVIRRYKRRAECYWCGRLVGVGRTATLAGPARRRVRQCEACARAEEGRKRCTYCDALGATLRKYDAADQAHWFHEACYTRFRAWWVKGL